MQLLLSSIILTYTNIQISEVKGGKGWGFLSLFVHFMCVLVHVCAFICVYITCICQASFSWSETSMNTIDKSFYLPGSLHYQSEYDWMMLNTVKMRRKQKKLRGLSLRVGCIQEQEFQGRCYCEPITSFVCLGSVFMNYLLKQESEKQGDENRGEVGCADQQESSSTSCAQYVSEHKPVQKSEVFQEAQFYFIQFEQTSSCNILYAPCLPK